MRILDFGAGYTAQHTKALRAMGYKVTAWDFGRNYVPGLHNLEECAAGNFDVVYASNVVNVHCSLSAVTRCVSQIASRVSDAGFVVLNYPGSPRKLESLRVQDLHALLSRAFHKVERIPDQSCPVWRCAQPDRLWNWDTCTLGPDYTPEEIACANIRPVGAVGANALVPRLVVSMLQARQFDLING